jgi:hypothetical protein
MSYRKSKARLLGDLFGKASIFTYNSASAQEITIDSEKAAVASSNVTSTTLDSISEDILPSANNTHSLGSVGMVWRDMYLGPGSLYVNGKKVLSDESDTITLATDTNQSLALTTTGTGETNINSNSGINIIATGAGDVTLQTTSGNIEARGTLQLLSGKRITDSAGTKVQFGDSIEMNGNKIIGLGTPTADTDAATKAYVDANGGGGGSVDLSNTNLAIDDRMQVANVASAISTAIANLVDTAPSTLDTLNELAAALGDDANFSTTVANTIATKLDITTFQAALANTNAYIAASASSGSGSSSYVTLTQEGTLETLTGTARWYAPKSITISNITARVDTASAGSSVNLTVLKNGTSVATMSISAGGVKATNTTGFSMVADDYLTINVTQVGSSTAGDTLKVTFEYS